MFPHRACNLTGKPTLTFILLSESNIRQYVIAAQGPDGNDSTTVIVDGNAKRK